MGGVHAAPRRTFRVRHMREISKRPTAWGAWRRMSAGVVLGLTLGLSLTAPAARAQPTPAVVVTILDGKATLLRGAGKLELAEGVRLQSQDVVETAADARLLRLEFADGLALSLGPASRMLIDPHFVGERGRAARVYLLRGWVKLNAAAPVAGSKPTAPMATLASPALDLLSAGGSVVASVQGTAAETFVESGELTLQERNAGNPLGTPQKLRNGEFFARAANARSAIASRPPAAFVQQMPRSFMDTLPSRAAMFKDRETTPRSLADITYADAQDWLAAEPTLRRPAMNRWRPLTRNPAFRNALVANMAAHPEWDRVLFPEKYLPKPGSSTHTVGTGAPLR